MFGDYDFKTDDELLLYLEITSSFFPCVFFKIYRNKNNDFIVYWRKKLDDNEFFTRLDNELSDIIKHTENINELYQTTEYKAFLNKHSPINKAVLNDYQKTLVTDLINNGLNKEVDMPHGCDGHSYMLKLYYPEPERFYCWCILPKEWKYLEDVINFLVKEVAGLDYSKYGIKGIR